tara:strand:- start:94 stop:453 length:360 start_codon:yes stop_codon:yes gene_type:complete
VAQAHQELHQKILVVQVLVEITHHLINQVNQVLNQHNQVIQAHMVLEILAVTDFIHHLQQALKVAVAVVQVQPAVMQDQITWDQAVQEKNIQFQVHQFIIQVVVQVADIKMLQVILAEE